MPYNKLLNIALAEDGYLEKATNSQLDDKTSNAGYNNFTKYGRDMDAITGFFNGRKNGFAWCAVFVCWCFVQAFGIAMTRELLGLPENSSAAGVLYLKRYMDAIGCFHKNTPAPGDVIFFVDSSGGYQHVGIVYDVNSSRVYTIEGNTSTASGVVDNGGGVCKKSYSLAYSRIAGYGRPKWSKVATVKPEDVISKNAYLTLAEMQINARYIFQVLSAEGWTRNAVAGMLGNMQTESTINPGIWQSLDAGNTSGGYGLVQWTPATKYLDWCTSNGLQSDKMDSALGRIKYELENGLQYYPTDDYPLTFQEFKTSTQNPNYLAMAFLANYERPADPDQPERGTQAEYWYNYLGSFDNGAGGGSGGTEPDTPSRPIYKPEIDEDGNIIRKKKMALWLIVAASRK